MRIATSLTRVALALASLGSARALAEDIAAMQGLQHGPLGGGPAFTSFEAPEFESAFATERDSGVARTSRTRLDGSTVERNIAVGFGGHVNSALDFIGGVRVHQDETVLSAGNDYSYSDRGGATALNAGPSLHLKPLLIGGSVTAYFIEDRRIEITRGATGITHVLPAVVSPSMTLFIGLETGPLTTVIGAENPEQTPVQRQSETTTGLVTYSEGSHRLPERRWLDARLHLLDSVDLALNITGVTSTSSSTVGDSHEFMATDRILNAVPSTRDYNEPRDHTRLSHAIGGIYHASSHLDLSSAVRVVSASYRDEEMASLAARNMAGTEIHVGLGMKGEEGIRGAFDCGYRTATPVSYTVSDPVITPWAEKGDRVTVEQWRWTLRLNGSMPL